MRPHEREDRARHPDVAEQFQVPVVDPLGVRNVEKGAAPDGAGVVDEDVDAPQALSRGRHHPLDLHQLGQVRRDHHDVLLPPLADFGGDAIEPGLLARADRHPRALGGEPERDRPPDSLAAAGHQRRLAFQFEVHRDVLLRGALRFGRGARPAAG
jgi:hypothetical protein